MNGLLITFGCSWMYGVGASYTKGVDRKKYEKYAFNELLNDPFTFRTLISKKYNLENRNFSVGGGSNQGQFRRAEEFFISEEFKNYKNRYKKIIVLWGITSIHRREFFYKNQWHDYSLNGHKHLEQRSGIGPEIERIITEDFHDNKNEINRLYTQMLHWNDHFKYLGVKNIWFDTFNHHKYNGTIENMCFDQENPRDIFSKMVEHEGPDNYHYSIWKLDSQRVIKSKSMGIVNPYSLHPERSGHQIIANILDPFIKEHIQE